MTEDMIHVKYEHRGNEIGINILSDSLTVCSVDKNDMEITKCTGPCDARLSITSINGKETVYTSVQGKADIRLTVVE